MKSSFLIFSAALALGATSVSATVYNFSVVNTFQGNSVTSGSYVPDFQFNINDAAGVGDSFSVQFNNVLTTGQRPYLGVPAGDVTYTVDYTFDFGNGTSGGGFTDATAGQTYAVHSYFGPQLYGGTPFAPTFTPGVYKLFFSNGFTATTPADALLTITGPAVVVPPASAVPEPATWAMMLVGFGGIGYAMRRNRKPAVSFS